MTEQTNNLEAMVSRIGASVAETTALLRNVRAMARIAEQQLEEIQQKTEELYCELEDTSSW